MLIPCFVSGKGVDATDHTKTFRRDVFHILESTGLGYDTRFRYYQTQYPELAHDELAQMVCNPFESYDKEWNSYLAAHSEGKSKDEVISAFVLDRDKLFCNEAQAAIYCYDEAGFGSGINTMRFIQAKKPIIGFYNPEVKTKGVNIHNILQLTVEFPDLVTLVRYHTFMDIQPKLISWLGEIATRSAI
ncbi:MAG TPA: hypothetical protein VF708_07115 [Pyrinomonadaceae bacterium]|jgi:hypothetical protein